MDRKWQKAPDRFQDLIPYQEFVSTLPACGAGPTLCSTFDLYAAFSTLHAKGRKPVAHVHEGLGLRFLTVDVPAGVQEQLGAEANSSTALSSQTSASVQPCPTDITHKELQQHGSDVQSCEGDGTSSGGPAREVVVPVSSACGQLTFQVLQHLFDLVNSPLLIVRWHLLLAIVDESGAVSMIRMFRHLQPPFPRAQERTEQGEREEHEDSD